MFPIKQGHCPATLVPWGTVADLGSEILEGECLASGAMVHGAPNSSISCGYFACTKGRFRMVYPFNEHATVVLGKVTLTNEATGEQQSYGVGDSWFIAKGTPILWHVESDSFTKNYMAAV
jgi:uncharacterized protein